MPTGRRVAGDPLDESDDLWALTASVHFERVCKGRRGFV